MLTDWIMWRYSYLNTYFLKSGVNIDENNILNYNNKRRGERMKKAMGIN